MVDHYRLLEETCQAALAILPCNLAWLLTVEGATLQSRAIVTDKAESAAKVFLRLVTGGSPEHPALPMVLRNNPIAEAALRAEPQVNLEVTEIEKMPGGNLLYRALSQLWLTHVHFLPLVTSEVIGIMMLAASGPHNMESMRGRQILNALIGQATNVVENTRLVKHLAEHEAQMRSEQAFRKMILDTMADCLLVLDDGAKIRYANNRLLNMTSYTRKELYGNSVGIIFHPEGRETLVRNLRADGRGTVSFYQQLITKDGRMVPVLMSRATAPSIEYAGQSTVLVLTDLTDQKAREQALEAQSERLRALNRAVQALTSSLTLEHVLGVILHSVGEIANSVSACVFLPSGDQPDVLRAVVATGPQAASLQGVTLRFGEGIAGKAAQERKPRLELNIEEGTAAVRAGDSVVAVPLLLADQAIGVLEVINKAEGEFTREDVEALENLAGAASVAIEKARLFDQTQRRVSELSTLLEASAAVSSTLDIGSVLELITRDLRDALKVARCAIATWNQAANQLVVVAEACNAHWRAGEGPERQVAALLLTTGMLRGGKPLLARKNDSNLPVRLRNHLERTSMSALILAPLRFSQTIFGVVELYKAADQQPFNALNLQAVEDALTQWHSQVMAKPSEKWRHLEGLTTLSQSLIQASRAAWCIISFWDRQRRTAHAIREIGFAVWDESSGRVHRLSDYPTMATSLEHGLPMTLYPALLRDDPNERELMASAGATTGLVTPLLVRGEASGLVKLLETDPNRSFDLAEISLSQGIANVVANALENARLFQSLERRANALQAAYDDLRRSDELKDKLIQSLSHELKTPLHKMSMQLELLAEGAFGPLTAEQRENMLSLINWSTGLGQLVDDMMSLHALDSQEIAFSAVSLEALGRQALAKAEPKARRANIRLELEAEPSLPMVRGDPEKLSEVIEQLLDNAIKFSPNADTVRLSLTAPEGPMVSLCVEDHGIGIPQEEFERIFQRGYQVDGSTTRRYGGTGLGLAIARRVIEAHGGRIWVESAVGQGSKFRCLLPRWQ